MKYFPLFFRMTGVEVLVIGAGQVALRKIRSFMAAGAKITVIAPEIHPEILEIADLKIKKKNVEAEDISGAYTMAILATDSMAVNEEIGDLCREKGILVNRCDDPDSSDFITGSVIDRPPLIIGMNSSGSPAVSRLVKKHLERHLDPDLPVLAEVLNDIRPIVRSRLKNPEKRETFLRKWATEEAFARLKQEGKIAFFEEMMRCLSTS